SIESELTQQVGIVNSYEDLAQNIEKGRVSVMLHIEGAECINSDLSNIEEYYEKGIRSIGPVWSRPNVFGNGVPFKFPSSPDTGDGLTEAGKELIKKCNELGILVDLAHINYKGFFDVARITTKPLIVSHTAVNRLCNSTRNLLDDQIDEVGKSHGIIGIIFEPINTRSNGKENEDTSLQVIVDHILYVGNRIGFECVGFGSDFDGAQTPKEMKNVSKIQNLIEKLRANGLGEEVIEKIAFGNWLRVIKETFKI
ncbi:MAG: membrane dipeptidase, partial [Candidatus Magasanikiibacteriota bacterium]